MLTGHVSNSNIHNERRLEARQKDLRALELLLEGKDLDEIARRTGRARRSTTTVLMRAIRMLYYRTADRSEVGALPASLGEFTARSAYWAQAFRDNRAAMESLELA